MLKSQYFVLAALLLSGTALGFMDIFHFGKRASSDSREQNTLISRSAPLFGEKNTRKNSNQITPSLANLESLVSQYAEMPAEEIKIELKRLIKLAQKDKFFHDDMNDSEMIANYLAYKLGSEFPSEVRNFIENDIEGKDQPLTTLLIRGWAQNDFEGAMDFLLNQDNKFYIKVSTFSQMMNDLTCTDPEKSMEWCLAQRGKVRDKGLISVMDALVGYHPEKIGEFVGKFNSKDWRAPLFLSDIAEKWAGCDWENAKRWADSLSGEKKKEALEASFRGLSAKDLDKATEEFKKQPAEWKGVIAEGIVRSIAFDENNILEGNLENKKQAFDWLAANMSDESNLSNIIHRIMGPVVAVNPEFTDYVKKMPEGILRDTALTQIARNSIILARNGEHAYEEAFALADQITRPEIKQSTIMNNITNWISADPESARTWIQEKSGLSDEEKQIQLDKCDQKLKQQKAKYKQVSS